MNSFVERRCFGWFLIVIIGTSDAHVLRMFQNKPPPAKYQYNKKAFQSSGTGKLVLLQPDKADETNIWEESGLFEGDIMTYGVLTRNGISSDERRWPNATVPFHIDDSFSNAEVDTIIGAMQEYHNRTCIRFRPYTKHDTNWIEILSDYSGCWSSVGMRDEGQVVNLNAPRCVRHGVVVHELMHAIGFYHQQSAANRDEHVKINWENIREGRQSNFKKYNTSAVNDFNVTYDYDSVMHYSAKAFSKNGEKTIEPLDPDAQLGQRVGLSEKDVMKLNLMYDETCNTDTVNVLEWFAIESEGPDDRPQKVVSWIEQFFGH